MKSIAYVVGIPGSGKSSLVAAALKGVMAVPVKNPVSHIVYQGRGIQLGAKREAFSGTDALPMNVQPLATAWLTDDRFPYSYVVAEGDRLANSKFFQALADAGWDVSVIYLRVPPEVAAERRTQRGSNQDETWLAGRCTKIENIVAEDWPDWELDGTFSIEYLAEALREQHPVFRALLGKEPL